jgi:hypothetical protein
VLGLLESPVPLRDPPLELGEPRGLLGDAPLELQGVRLERVRPVALRRRAVVCAPEDARGDQQGHADRTRGTQDESRERRGPDEHRGHGGAHRRPRARKPPGQLHGPTPSHDECGARDRHTAHASPGTL